MRKLTSSPLSDIDAAGLPRDWSLVSLGDILLGAQYGLNSPTDEAGTVAIVGMKDIQNGKVCINDLPKVNITSTEKTAHLLRKGDILINRTNSRDLVGKTGIVDSDIDAVFASYLVRLRTRPEYVDSSYLTYWLNSPSAQGTIKRIATPAVSQSNVNPTELQRFCVVPLPSLLEQQHITEILRIWDDGIDKIDASEQEISLLREERRLLERQKRGLMQQLFAGQRRVPINDSHPTSVTRQVTHV
jgi:type I restriction enzyme S subunit